MEPAQKEISLLDVRGLAKLMGVSASTIHRWKAAQFLPPAIHFTPGVTRWNARTILRWIDACERSGKCLYQSEWNALADKEITLLPEAEG